MKSKNSPLQFDLIDGVPQKALEFSIDLVRKQQTFGDAISLSQTLSGLKDKQIYKPLGIDAGQYSRIKNADAWFPNDEKYLGFLNLTDNDIPTIWAAECRGYDWSSIRRHRSSAEREAEYWKAECAKRDEAIALIVKAAR